MTLAPCLLYVGTEDGIYVLLQEKEQLRPIGRGLEGNAVRAIAIHRHDPRRVYVGCGLRGWGLHMSENAGRSFVNLGLTDKWVWEVAFHPSDPNTILVGTEPPMLYISHDGGKTLRFMPNIESLPSRSKWMFFHPPFYAGHIHGISIHPHRTDRIFAGVEQGALIYSHDEGQTWNETLVGCDVHRVAIDPLDADRIFVGAGEGLFVSRDAGRTWQPVQALRGKYVHGIVFADQRTMYVYADEEISPLYKSEDRGETWKQIGKGLPASGPSDNLSLHPDDSRCLFYGGDLGPNEGGIFISVDGGDSWRLAHKALPKIWRLRSAKTNNG